MIGFGQLTYVPDDAFEGFLEANGMGDGIALNDNVFTSAIDTVAYLDVSNQNISDLTGFEAFTVLTNLNCEGNQLSILDVSQNIALIYLNCEDNQLTSLDLINNTAIIQLKCQGNQLTSLDLSQNSALNSLYCSSNQLTSLDISQNSALTSLYCPNNQLTSLDVRNGNNINIDHLSYPGFKTENNPNLACIDVDDVNYSTTNWTDIDSQHYFSTNCPPPSAIQDHTTTKELLKVTDLLGRETKQTNQPLFYICEDGTVEKRIIIE